VGFSFHRIRSEPEGGTGMVVWNLSGLFGRLLGLFGAYEGFFSSAFAFLLYSSCDRKSE